MDICETKTNTEHKSRTCKESQEGAEEEFLTWEPNCVAGTV